jgi:ATP-binding cassette subfamily F protein uup
MATIDMDQYDGTVFLVSHDRRFLDNVVTSTLAFEGDGQWREYEGDVQDWLTQSARSASLARASSATAPSSANTAETAAPISSTAATPPNPSEASKEKTPLRNVDKQVTPQKKKLSYKEQRELDALPSLIDTLEEEQRTIDSLLANGQLYVSDPAQAAKLSTRHAQIDDELLAALERLDALS